MLRKPIFTKNSPSQSPQTAVKDEGSHINRVLHHHIRIPIRSPGVAGTDFSIRKHGEHEEKRFIRKTPGRSEKLRTQRFSA